MDEIGLSPRQRECLRLVYERRTSKEIAGVLGLRVGTVDTYIADATSALGARNRRHAAEVLRAVEQAEHDPEKLQSRETGLSERGARAATDGAGNRLRNWAAMVPLRIKGAPGNDLTPLLRFGWIVQLAISIAVGFGMLVVGLEVISRFFGRR